jgi:hypothetical protein
MTRRRPDPVFPEGISDETASALSEFLHQLAAACENRYFAQLGRHHRRQRNRYDPEAPWRTLPDDIP